MAQLGIRNITKKYDNTEVLKGINLQIRDGEFISLVGPSGCGKSTMLRIISGLEQQTSGSISISGEKIDTKRPKDRDLAMVFQSYALYPHLTVFDNIAVPLRMRQLTTLQRLPLFGRFMSGHKATEMQIDTSVTNVADMLDIQHLLKRKPGQLSGGQRQRVAVGRAMVREPKAFLMDEPLSNLDTKLRVHMRTEIAQLHKRLSTTFIYVTHDQAEAMSMSDRIAVMMDGEILQLDTPSELYNNPNCIRVAEFIGSPKINLLPATISDQNLIVLAGKQLPLLTPELMPGQKIQCGIRSEALEVVSSHPDLLSGIITHIENLGSDYLLHIKIEGSDQHVVVREEPQAAMAIRINDTVGITLPAKGIMLFAKDGARIQTPVKEATHFSLLVNQVEVLTKGDLALSPEAVNQSLNHAC